MRRILIILIILGITAGAVWYFEFRKTSSTTEDSGGIFKSFFPLGGNGDINTDSDNQVSDITNQDNVVSSSSPFKQITTRPIAGFTVERMIGLQPAVFFGIIKDVHKMPLAQIAQELNRYGTAEIMSVPQLAKEHILSNVPWILRRIYIAIALHIPFLRQIVNPATFGLTSLGKFGLNTLLAPNISTCIFGVGTVEPRVKVIENEIKARRMMSVVFSSDTLVVDMGQAAQFLAAIQALIESGLAGHLTDEELALANA